MRPLYEALDARGVPYMRPARVIGELPTANDRAAALAEALPHVEAIVGQKAVCGLKFGCTVATSFMKDRLARRHDCAGLLLTKGEGLMLELCPSFSNV